MCDMLHPGKFVFDASVSDHGCSLRCIYFDSSVNATDQIFDVSIQKEHNLNDGIYCRRDHVSNNNNNKTEEVKEKKIINVYTFYRFVNQVIAHLK